MTHLSEFDAAQSRRYTVTRTMREDIRALVADACDRCGRVNVPVVAEKVRLQHETQNIAREDIEAEVMRVALEMNAIISSDSKSLD